MTKYPVSHSARTVLGITETASVALQFQVRATNQQGWPLSSSIVPVFKTPVVGPIHLQTVNQKPSPPPWRDTILAHGRGRRMDGEEGWTGKKDGRDVPPTIFRRCCQAARLSRAPRTNKRCHSALMNRDPYLRPATKLSPLSVSFLF
jgi:hypothetical protein